MIVEPIGTFFGDATYKYDVPRQGKLFAGHPGRIELLPGKNFEMALRDLEGFERIWLIFQFHENEGWRPTTKPPVPPKDRDRVGTFASRSPYRPNAIGLSCVRLLKIDKLTLFVDEADLLNGTPILDIKPYIPMADAFPEAKAGWVEEQESDKWKICATEFFEKQNSWLGAHSAFDLLSFAMVQLVDGPFDDTRRRVIVEEESGILAYRTFRIHFTFDVEAKTILLKKISSGYKEAELASLEDVFGDKALHRLFCSIFR